MDNASKAILFAGAMLIATGLIGIGIYMFKMGGTATTEVASTMTSNEIMAINSQFTRYRGSCMGVEAKQMIRAVYTHNMSSDSLVTVNSYPVNTSDQLRDMTSGNKLFTGGIKDNKEYTVTIAGTDYNSAGLIRNIQIAE